MRSFIGMSPMAWLLALVSAASAQELDYTSEPLEKIKAKVESKKAILADVRELPEWDKGHLKDAVFLPLSKLSAWEQDGLSDLEKAKLSKSLPKGSVVYCHCAAGGRAVPGAKASRNSDTMPVRSRRATVT